MKKIYQKTLFALLIIVTINLTMVVFYNLVYIPYLSKNAAWTFMLCIPITLLFVLQGALIFYVFKKELGE